MTMTEEKKKEYHRNYNKRYNKDYYHNNKEHEQKRYKQWYNDNKEHVKTMQGRLKRMHRDMRQRTKQKGFDNIISQEEFIKYGMHNDDYIRLYKEWVDSNYEFKLTPTVDRINNMEGYIYNNIQFLAHNDNARKGTKDHHKNRHIKMTMPTGESLLFEMASECDRYLGACKGGTLHAIYRGTKLHNCKVEYIDNIAAESFSVVHDDG